MSECVCACVCMRVRVRVCVCVCASVDLSACVWCVWVCVWHVRSEIGQARLCETRPDGCWLHARGADGWGGQAAQFGRSMSERPRAHGLPRADLRFYAHA